MITIKLSPHDNPDALQRALRAAGIEASPALLLPPDVRLDLVAKALNGCGSRLSGRVVRGMTAATEPTAHPTVARIRAARIGGGL